MGNEVSRRFICPRSRSVMSEVGPHRRRESVPGTSTVSSASSTSGAGHDVSWLGWWRHLSSTRVGIPSRRLVELTSPQQERLLMSGRQSCMGGDIARTAVPNVDRSDRCRVPRTSCQIAGPFSLSRCALVTRTGMPAPLLAGTVRRCGPSASVRTTTDLRAWRTRFSHGRTPTQMVSSSCQQGPEPVPTRGGTCGAHVSQRTLDS